MPPRSTGPANAATIKRSSLHLGSTTPSANSDKNSTEDAESEPPLVNAPQPAENRREFPCSFSLNGLVRLDWSRRTDLFPHGPGKTKFERFGFNGRTFAVESLDPGTAGNAFVILCPEKRYYAVPIYEEPQSANRPTRLLLIQVQKDPLEPGPHIYVVEPPTTDATLEPFAHLHIIGGEDDKGTDSAALRPVGIVEAILTATETASATSSHAPVTQTAEPPPSPPSSPPPDLPTPQADPPVPTAAPNEPDPDLLACIDYIREAQAIYTHCEPALTRVQRKFYDYLQNKFEYSAIPIDMGMTLYDESAGHQLTHRPISGHLTGSKPRAIVQVLKDGFKQREEIKRRAEVVTNQPPLTVLRRIKRVRLGRFYIGIETPEPLAIEQLIDEAAGHFRVMDGIYSVLAITRSASGNLNSLAAVLQRYTDSSLQLEQIADHLDEQLRSAGLARLSLRLHYAQRDVPQDTQFDFIVIGVDEVLTETREIILRQAARQDAFPYCVLPDVEWLKTRLQRLRQLTDQTAEALARGIATLLGNLAFAPGLLNDQFISKIEFEPIGPTQDQPLLPDVLATKVSPYLCAIADMQHALDRIHPQESGAVTIYTIQANPIQVRFRGGRDAVKHIRKAILPWRATNAKRLNRIIRARIKADSLMQTARTPLRQARIQSMRAQIVLFNTRLELEETNLARSILAEAGLDFDKLTAEQARSRIDEVFQSVRIIVNSELSLAPG